jgi:hypothetical protein
MTYVCVHKHMLQNTFRNSIYVFRPKGNSLHSEDMLHNLCFNVQKKCCLFHNFIFLCSKKILTFSQIMNKFKYQSGHLKVTVWQLRETENKYLHCYNIQLTAGIQ